MYSSQSPSQIPAPPALRVRAHRLVSRLGSFALRLSLSLWLCLGLGLTLGALGGCSSTLDVKANTPLNARATWALLPFGDYGETPQAAERAEELASSLMQVRWNIDMVRYPTSKESLALVDLDERQRYEKALQWARDEGIIYGLAGSVQEWRYRSGAEGEAAVGLSLRVINIQTGRSEWLATGSRSGFGSQPVSGVAERLIGDMVGRIRLR